MSEKHNYEDTSGKWLVKGNVDILIEPSPEWLERQKNIEIIEEPSQEEINVEFDYRLSLVELGLQ